MIKICGLALGVAIVLLILIEYSRERDFLHPAVVFLFLEFIKYVPGLLLLQKESSIVFTSSGALTLVLFETIYIISALVGMGFAKRIYVRSGNKVYDVPLFNIIVFFGIGLAAKILVINKLGGLGFVLSNPQLAYQMQGHGYGIYTVMYKFMQVAILAMCEKAVLHREQKKYVFMAALMIIIYMLSFLIYTSRTPGLIMLLIVFFIINYEVRTINFRKLFNWKVLLVLLFIFASSYYAANSRTSRTAAVANSAVVDMITNFSNDGRDMFVYEYFSSHEKWLGKGYLNIIPSIIPGVTNKPSTDDGLYLVNLIRGFDVDINANYNTLPSSTGSVPFSTPAYMFANFGVLGLVLGGMIIGIVNMLTYKHMIYNLNAFNVAIYFFIVYQFGLSTGRMVPVLITIVFVVICKRFIRIRFTFGGSNRNQEFPARKIIE